MGTAYVNIRRYNPAWGSHMPVLTKVMELSDGPVLELGMGLFSTPLLHMLCFNKDRHLTSYESDEKFFKMHGNFVSPLHRIEYVTDWDSIRIDETPWGVVFVDHEADRRAIETKRVANMARFVVIHDSEKRNDEAYGYPSIYPLFKYRLDYTKAVPHTTILSNFVDLSNIKI